MSGLQVPLTLAFAFGLWSGQRSAESLEILTLESSSPLCTAKGRKLRMKRDREGVAVVSCCFLQRIIAAVNTC